MKKFILALMCITFGVAFTGLGSDPMQYDVNDPDKGICILAAAVAVMLMALWAAVVEKPLTRLTLWSIAVIIAFIFGSWCLFFTGFFLVWSWGFLESNPEIKKSLLQVTKEERSEG